MTSFSVRQGIYDSADDLRNLREVAQHIEIIRESLNSFYGVLQALRHDEDLERLDDIVNSLDNLEDAISKFLLLRSAGHVEYVVKNMVKDAVKHYVLRDSSQESEYFTKLLNSALADNQVVNPSWGNIVKHISQYDKDWKEAIDDRIDEDAKENLNRITKIRNSVAHGGSQNVSRVKAIEDSEFAEEFANIVVDVISPKG
ncbi:MAG: HEPN domain-containing protein [Rothia sp. (in: high G+C Gram-positive bacteria)]|uniref:HEPN domain-containing protein n=1 Tax=Rothia sp. (in: high G+C Gram-positive bacteria) TaxID=1885016 RepID=UPI0026DF1211|nr:HEPN domain-containing protein [Rothia sp. (in: high G+C Gram-positive bacteria)]MDO5751080.1 HEPN domain-containing protein [Rothia sp. (in: high G+C Gram-positive bacteria)]